MLESFIVAGSQELEPGCEQRLVYGQSVTDACIAARSTESTRRPACT
jgi:phospho-2-dehydro-3-deoxyheptonate aldolase